MVRVWTKIPAAQEPGARWQPSLFRAAGQPASASPFAPSLQDLRNGALTDRRTIGHGGDVMNAPPFPQGQLAGGVYPQISCVVPVGYADRACRGDGRHGPTSSSRDPCGGRPQILITPNTRQMAQRRRFMDAAAVSFRFPSAAASSDSMTLFPVHCCPLFASPAPQKPFSRPVLLFAPPFPCLSNRPGFGAFGTDHGLAKMRAGFSFRREATAISGPQPPARSGLPANVAVQGDGPVFARPRFCKLGGGVQLDPGLQR